MAEHQREQDRANGKYVNAAVCLEKRQQCAIRLQSHDESIRELKDGQKAINQKLTATLVTVIVTLVSVVVKLVFK